MIRKTATLAVALLAALTLAACGPTHPTQPPVDEAACVAALKATIPGTSKTGTHAAALATPPAACAGIGRQRFLELDQQAVAEFQRENR